MFLLFPTVKDKNILANAQFSLFSPFFKQSERSEQNRSLTSTTVEVNEHRINIDN